MKHAASNLVTVLVLTLLFTPALQAAAKKRKPSRSFDTDQADTVASRTKPMTVWQARRTVLTGLKTFMPRSEFNWGAGNDVKMHPESIRVSAGSIECAADVSDWGFGTKLNLHTESCEADLKSMGTLGVKRFRHQYELTENGKRGLKGLLGTLAWATDDEAQAVADAVNRLRAAARGQDGEFLESDWPEFQREAAAWRALAVKPAISEDVRRHRLLAENAVKESHFDSAVEEYEAGLEIDPVWPEGHFNAALLCAEQGYYSEAMHHMRAYLELTPEAPDAQQARDQVVIWEAKLR